MVDKNSPHYVKSTYDTGWYREKGFIFKGPLVYRRRLKVEGNDKEEVKNVLDYVGRELV